MRLFMADDERPVIEALSHIVRRELAQEFEIAGTASSGREAVEKVLQLVPDIVLMDVRMPGLSGLEAVRELKDRGSSSSVILLTAYERFDIARESVELGVVDYLLKPVSKDALCRSLRSAVGFVERRAREMQREIEFRERSEEARDLAETALLQGLMLGQRPADLDRYRRLLSLNEEFVIMAAVSVVPPPGAPGTESIFEALRQTLRYKTRALLGPAVHGLCALYLPLRDPASASEAQAALSEVIETAHGEYLERGWIRIGFGKAVSAGEARISWENAIQTILSGALDASMQVFEDFSVESFDDDMAFIEAIRAGIPERAGLALEAILGKYGEGRPLAKPELFRIIALIAQAVRELRQRGVLSLDAAKEAMDLSDLLDAPNSELIMIDLRSRFASLAEAIREAPRQKTALDAAIEKLKNEFDRPISLDSVASDLAISPARLSRLFIEGTGQGFSDFLIEYRIEKAKEMLSKPEASIKQVANACGYSDPNYFSRLFKKVTGFTPSSFAVGGMEAGNENRD